MPRISQNSALAELLLTVRQLFPEATVDTARVDKGQLNLRLVPGRRNPRLAVPAWNFSAASDAMLRPSASDTFLTSLRRRVLAVLLAGPLGTVAMPHGINISSTKNSIVEYLSEVLGEPVDVSLMVGSARANRKPILNVHSHNGAELGFAKLALSELTQDLVRHEGSTLERLSSQRGASFLHPRVLHAGLWNGHEILLLSALRPDKRQKQGQLPAATVAGIIQTAKITHMPIKSSGWLKALLKESDGLRGSDDQTLPHLIDEFVQAYGSVEIPFGAWHGDFGPWNMAYTSSVPMVWDWERYAEQVPAGMDVIHYLSHEALRLRDHAAARHALETVSLPALDGVLGLVPNILEPEPQVLKAIQLGYLLTIGSRFTLDSRKPGGGHIGGLARWHLDMVEDQLAREIPAEFHRKREPSWP